MKSPIFRTAAAFALAALLAACGGSPSDQEVLTAASMQTGVTTTAVAGGVSAALATPSANTSAPTVIAANSPAPDCAADGCSSLRIIDGNAEAWRYDAMRRAAPQT
jgi:hypothetical protein